MALTSCNDGRCDSLWDPFRRGSSWEPIEIVFFPPSRSSSKRVRTDSKPNPLEKRPRTSDGTKVDWLETDDAHVIKADLPGFKKEDIKVELEDDKVLQISGERIQEEEKQGDRWHMVERSRSKFFRRFKLPGPLQAESVSATVEDGVLTVTLPKTQAKTPETRNIEIA